MNGEILQVFSECVNFAKTSLGHRVLNSVKQNCTGGKYYLLQFELKLSLIEDVLHFGIMYDGKGCGEITPKFG